MNCIFFVIFTIFIKESVSSNLKDFELPKKFIQFKDISPVENSKSVTKIQLRIFGGKNSKPGQFPYQVGLYIPLYRGYGMGRWCGGTLISEKFILTAAHCLYHSSEFEFRLTDSVIVFLGTTDRRNPNENGQIRFEVLQSNLIPHPYYDPAPINDIALIKLPVPVKLNKNIQLAKLPKPSNDRSDLIGQTITSSGWGFTGPNKKTDSPDILQYMNTEIRPHDECYRIFPYTYRPEQQICINSNGKSTCHGDSGGPHVISESDGTKTIIGITSYGYQTCHEGYPQVLTRVSYFLPWINRYLKNDDRSYSSRQRNRNIFDILRLIG